jgi:hypothetical protein
MDIQFILGLYGMLKNSSPVIELLVKGRLS